MTQSQKLWWWGAEGGVWGPVGRGVLIQGRPAHRPARGRHAAPRDWGGPRRASTVRPYKINAGCVRMEDSGRGSRIQWAVEGGRSQVEEPARDVSIRIRLAASRKRADVLPLDRGSP